MTEDQRKNFEAFAILKAHASLFVTLLDQGTLEQMAAQLALVAEALRNLSSMNKDTDAQAAA